MYKGSDPNEKSRTLLDPNFWVELYADYLYGYSLTKIKSTEVAKDLVQETFLSALQGADSFHGLCSEKTWLTAILKNKIVDFYRKEAAKFQNRPGPAAAENQAFFEAEDGRWAAQHYPVGNWDVQPDAMHTLEFQQILKACMAKLPPLWSSVFTMKHLDEEESEAIMRHLNLTASNYWVIIHRAKVNLRSCLQKNWI